MINNQFIIDDFIEIFITSDNKIDFLLNFYSIKLIDYKISKKETN